MSTRAIEDVRLRSEKGRTWRQARILNAWVDSLTVDDVLDLLEQGGVLFTITGARSRFLGRFAQAGRPGPNSKPWSGKLGKNRLSAGTYRVTLQAVDSRGRRSRPKHIAFKVVHP